MTPNNELYEFGAAVLRDAWNRRVTDTKTQATSLETELRATERKVGQFLDRIAETDSTALIIAYEKRIGELEARKLELSEKIAECGRPLARFDETFRTSMKRLISYCKLLDFSHVAHKRTVLKFTFADRLTYVRNEGF